MVTLLLTLGAMQLAHGAEPMVEVGIAAGVGMDLPDAFGTRAQFGLGPHLIAPVTVVVAEYAAVRASLRGDAGFGRAALWTEEADLRGEEWDARFFAGGLTLGPELRLPLGGVTVGLGAEAGTTLMRVDYALPDGGAFSVLDRKNTAQVSIVSDLHLGVSGGGTTGWFAELGYTMAWFDGGTLAESPLVRQSSWGWNAPRVGAGVRFQL